MVTVKKKKKASNQAQIDRIKAGSGGSRGEALELATSRARGQGLGDPGQTRTGEIVTAEDIRRKEIENIAQKNIDVKTEEGRIKAQQTIDAGGESVIQETEIQEGEKRKIGALDIIKPFRQKPGETTGEQLKQEAGLIAGGAVIGAAAIGGTATAGVVGGISGILAVGFAVDKLLLSPSELAVWAAVDNVASASSFQSNNLVSAVQFGGFPKDEALKQITELENTVEKSRAFTNRATRINPKLWPGRNMLMSSIETAQDTLAINKFKIESF